MKTAIKIASALLVVLYPLLVFSGLYYFSASPKTFALLAMGIVLVYFIVNTNNAKAGGFKSLQFWSLIIFVSVISIVSFFTENLGYFKFYPIIVNVVMLVGFGSTLKKPPNMIFRFASLDKKVKESDNQQPIIDYCYKVTIVWIVFFMLNGSIATATVIWGSDKIWAIYNGIISYILIGLLFGIEFIIRKIKQI